MKKFRVLYVSLFSILSGLLAGYFAFAAEEQTQKIPVEVYSEISTSYDHYNVKGYRGKVGEYAQLDSGLKTAFYLEMISGKTHLDASGEIRDKRDQMYQFNVDYKRFLQTSMFYSRYRHYLDHDQLENQDYATDYDVGVDNGITIEELKADNTLRIPSLPFLKFTADVRRYSKRGQRQATTVSKSCGQCHVTSRNKRINQDTDEIKLGVEGSLGPATLRYVFSQQRFNEGAEAPTANYGDGASFFNVRGRAPYSRVPDFKTQTHKVSLHSMLPFDAGIFASLQSGRRTNRDIHSDVRFRNIAARLSKYLTKRFSCDLFYSNYHMDSNVPDARVRDMEKGGLSFNARFFKRTNLKFTCIWENTDRSNFIEGYTRKKTCRLTLNRRIMHKLRLHMRYEKSRTHDPFVLRDSTFGSLAQTSLPRDEDWYYMSLNWNPRANFSLTTNLRYLNSRNKSYDVDEDRYEFVLSAWYMPLERLTLTGAFTLIDNEVDTPVAYKMYHLNGAESLVRSNDIPYDDCSRSLFISASYQVNPRLAFTGDITYIKSNSDFDSQLDFRNVGEFSNLEINQIQTSFGFTYLYSRDVSVYGKYRFQEYNDQEDDYFDGQFSLVSIGLNWAF
ncbi:MAG: MtrB/PioB family outer membrane beta-barrel protein [Deltaproteobacteria bacterium]|nr:MtrB/PioB family outer membrane beta-barrel protein [Deltaproteobacteria bacterium]